MRIKAVASEVSDYLIDRGRDAWGWYMSETLRFKVTIALSLAFTLLWLAVWVIW